MIIRVFFSYVSIGLCSSHFPGFPNIHNVHLGRYTPFQMSWDCNSMICLQDGMLYSRQQNTSTLLLEAKRLLLHPERLRPAHCCSNQGKCPERAHGQGRKKGAAAARWQGECWGAHQLPRSFFTARTTLGSTDTILGNTLPPLASASP